MCGGSLLAAWKFSSETEAIACFLPALAHSLHTTELRLKRCTNQLLRYYQVCFGQPTSTARVVSRLQPFEPPFVSDVMKELGGAVAAAHLPSPAPPPAPETALASPTMPSCAPWSSSDAETDPSRSYDGDAPQFAAGAPPVLTAQAAALGAAPAAGRVVMGAGRVVMGAGRVGSPDTTREIDGLKSLLCDENDMLDDMLASVDEDRFSPDTVMMDFFCAPN